MDNRGNNLANRQGFCVSAKLTLKEYTELEELIRARGINRSAWTRKLIQVSIAVQKNNNEAAQPPP